MPHGFPSDFFNALYSATHGRQGKRGTPTTQQHGLRGRRGKSYLLEAEPPEERDGFSCNTRAKEIDLYSVLKMVSKR